MRHTTDNCGRLPLPRTGPIHVLPCTSRCFRRAAVGASRDVPVRCIVGSGKDAERVALRPRGVGLDCTVQYNAGDRLPESPGFSRGEHQYYRLLVIAISHVLYL